jgi:hypothetical protein
LPKVVGVVQGLGALGWMPRRTEIKKKPTVK